MRYQSVLFTVPVAEQAEPDAERFVRRELLLERLLRELHAVSHPQTAASAQTPTRGRTTNP
jgi:hypothetical protein